MLNYLFGSDSLAFQVIFKPPAETVTGQGTCSRGEFELEFSNVSSEWNPLFPLLFPEKIYFLLYFFFSWKKKWSFKCCETIINPYEDVLLSLIV